MRYLPDTNVLLALTLSGHPHHRAAAAWLDGVDDRDDVLICRSTQQSLLRLLTTAAVFALFEEEPLTNAEAWAVSDALLADLRFSLLDVEPPGTLAGWRQHSSRPSSSPKVWMDAYLAAFAQAVGARLVTNDAAFHAYPKLEFVLVGPSVDSSGGGP